MRELEVETEKGSRTDGRRVVDFAVKLLARNRKLKENGSQILNPLHIVRRKEFKSYKDLSHTNMDYLNGKPGREYKDKSFFMCKLSVIK